MIKDEFKVPGEVISGEFKGSKKRSPIMCPLLLLKEGDTFVSEVAIPGNYKEISERSKLMVLSVKNRKHGSYQVIHISNATCDVPFPMDVSTSVAQYTPTTEEFIKLLPYIV